MGDVDRRFEEAKTGSRNAVGRLRKEMREAVGENGIGLVPGQAHPLSMAAEKVPDDGVIVYQSG